MSPNKLTLKGQEAIIPDEQPAAENTVTFTGIHGA